MSEKDTIETRRRRQQRGDGPKNEPRSSTDEALTKPSSAEATSTTPWKTSARQEHEVGTGRDLKAQTPPGGESGRNHSNGSIVTYAEGDVDHVACTNDQDQRVRGRAPRRATIRAPQHNSWKGVHSGAYRALPSRRVEIPKPDGGTRPLDTNSGVILSRQQDGFADAGLSDLLYPGRLKSLQESRGPEATACAAG